MTFQLGEFVAIVFVDCDLESLLLQVDIVRCSCNHVQFGALDINILTFVLETVKIDRGQFSMVYDAFCIKNHNFVGDMRAPPARHANPNMNSEHNCYYDAITPA